MQLAGGIYLNCPTYPVVLKHSIKKRDLHNFTERIFLFGATFSENFDQVIIADVQ